MLKPFLKRLPSRKVLIKLAIDHCHSVACTAHGSAAGPPLHMTQWTGRSHWLAPWEREHSELAA
jgi:hypothetical protein